MIDIIRECRKIVRRLALRLSRVRTKYVEREDIKGDIRGVVDGYFRTDRPILLYRLRNEALFANLDRNMQNLLQFTYRRTPTIRYKSTIARIQKEWEILEVKTIPLFGDLTGDEVPEFSPVEMAIIVHLQESCSPASLSYRQALEDLRNDERLSWRGTAVELREALREVLDSLAPDDVVKKSPDFKFDNDTKGITMKQKVSHILKTRRQSEKARKNIEQAVDVVDDKVGAFVRSLYDRSSVAVHIGRDKRELSSIKLFVDTVLIELLNIKE